MASLYSSLCGEGDMLPNTYLADQKLANSSKVCIIYVSQPC